MKDLGWELKILVNKRELGVQMGQRSWVKIKSPTGLRILGDSWES